MKINSYLKFSEVIKFEIGRSDTERYSSDPYSIYWEDKLNDFPKLDSVVYVGEGPEVDEVTLEETFPEEVAAKGWWICYSDELVQDVIDNAIYQKPDVSLEEINIAIGYYCQNDCFQTL